MQLSDAAKAQIFSLVRTGLKVVGAGLVTQGYMDKGVETWLAGLVSIGLGLAWSAWTHGAALPDA